MKSTIRSPRFSDSRTCSPTIRRLPKRRARRPERFETRPAAQRLSLATFSASRARCRPNARCSTSTLSSPTRFSFARSTVLQKTRVELQLESVLPGVRGDGNQLMQVFFNLVNNAVDAMESHEGGVRHRQDRARSRQRHHSFFRHWSGHQRAVIVFSIRFTRRSLSEKARASALSICFGIVQEHAGKIMCYNAQTGGAVFRVELPAVLAALPTREPHLAGATPLPLPPKR